MADPIWAATAATPPASKPRAQHPLLIRVTHWITAIAFLALLVTGIEILISHPRFYWGEAGNVRTPALFTIPIPASRATVPTGYNYVLPDQNGWSRSLHFQSAWLAVLTGLVYGVYGLATGHFRRNLLPTLRELTLSRLRNEDESYNQLQRTTYLLVIFFLFPLVIWTGLAMSPAIMSAFPAVVTLLGGQQSARTIHFFVAIFLTVFLIGHVVMVYLSGFRSRVRAMITGRPTKQ